MVQFGQKLPVLPSWEIANRLELMPEENQGYFSRERRSNEGFFCSDDRILLGLIAASLVLPPLADEPARGRPIGHPKHHKPSCFRQGARSLA
jgi:hypothetical protein